MATNEHLEHLKSLPDANTRAQYLLATSLAYTKDPELREVIENAARGDGYYSQVLAASLPRPDKKSPKPKKPNPNHPVNPFWKKGDK